MPRLAWLTDLHLNFVQGDLRGLREQLAGAGPEGVVITGDISETPTLARDLAALDRMLWMPAWLVLGNHDFYGGSIAAVRAQVASLCQGSTWLRYLPVEGVVPLGGGAGLVGHDGWADGRLGDYAGSRIVLNDFLVIDDLAGRSPQDRLARLHALGDEAAAYLRDVLPRALGRYRDVVVATHVPPFREACWHEGRPSDDQHLPHFTCAAVGDVLAQVAAARPDRRILVLCGHTHERGVARMRPNLVVRTGGAIYGQPGIAQVIDATSFEAD
jgi:3',5'-cyclic AMP phosphodiesterase CpdA